MIAKGIPSTWKVPPVVGDDELEPHPDPITEPTSNIHDVFVHCIENPLYDDYNTVGVDLPGRYPNTSVDGHKYIYAMHDTITNYINAKGLKSRRAPKLDNEISKKIVQLFEDQNLDYQLVATGDHQLLSTERAIQTFKITSLPFAVVWILISRNLPGTMPCIKLSSP